MSSPVERNVDGILGYMQDYLHTREKQVLRMLSVSENVMSDIIWIHLEILRKVLMKSKSFGGEKFEVARILAGADEGKRRALFSSSDQNSIMDELVERDDAGGKSGDLAIHDMRSLYRCVDARLEGLVQLIQHWVKWDLPDAADLHAFDEQLRRWTALHTVEITEEIRSRFRVAMGRAEGTTVTDEEIFAMESQRLNQVAGRFCARRQEEEPFEYIICRKPDSEGSEPYNYKLRQCDELRDRLETALR